MTTESLPFATPLHTYSLVKSIRQFEHVLVCVELKLSRISHLKYTQRWV